MKSLPSPRRLKHTQAARRRLQHVYAVALLSVLFGLNASGPPRQKALRVLGLLRRIWPRAACFEPRRIRSEFSRLKKLLALLGLRPGEPLPPLEALTARLELLLAPESFRPRKRPDPTGVGGEISGRP